MLFKMDTENRHYRTGMSKVLKLRLILVTSLSVCTTNRELLEN